MKGGEGARIANDLPVALASTILLGLGGILIGMTRLGEVAGKMLLNFGGAVSEGGMVAVSVLVRTSH